MWCIKQEENQCESCGGTGRIRPERVAVIPDDSARRIREFLRDSPDLLKESYEPQSDDPLEGLCYPAAEAYYHVTGCSLDIYCLSWEMVDPELDGTHWYLRDPETKEFIDLGLPVDQGVDLPPFEAGRRRGFMTGDTPSKRTQYVLESLGFK